MPGSFGEAREKVQDIQVVSHQDVAGVDQTAAQAVNAIGTIGGQVREGMIRRDLKGDLQDSANIIATLNSPDTELSENEDGSVAIDVSKSDPYGALNKTSEAWKRLTTNLDQGRITQQRAAIEAEVILRQSIARAPGMADAFRKQANEDLGFNASGAVLNQLFLSGTDTTKRRPTQTQQEKDIAMADMWVALGKVPTRESGLNIIATSQISALRTKIDTQALADGQIDATRIASMARESTQNGANDVILTAFQDIRTTGMVQDLAVFEDAINSDAETHVSNYREMMDNSSGRFTEANYKAVTEQIYATRDANLGLLRNNGALKVITERQELVQALMMNEALNVAPELLFMQQFGEDAMNTYIDLMTMSNGNPKHMEALMQRNPAMRYLGGLGLEIKNLFPAYQAILSGNVSAGLADGSIDERTVRGVTQALAQQAVNGVTPVANTSKPDATGATPVDTVNLVTPNLAALNMPQTLISTAAETKNSFGRMDDVSKATVKSTFEKNLPQMQLSLAQKLTGTEWNVGFNEKTAQFEIQSRDQSEMATDVETSRNFAGGFMTPAMLERMRTVKRAPGDVGKGELAAMNKGLKLLKDPRWAAHLGVQDPNKYATDAIAYTNSLIIDQEIASTEGNDAGRLGIAKKMDFNTEMEVKNAILAGDREGVMKILEDAGIFAPIEEATNVGRRVRLEETDTGARYIDLDSGNVLQFGSDGSLSSVSGLIDRTGRQAKGAAEAAQGAVYKAPKISKNADPAVVQIVADAAGKYGIPPEVLFAMVQQESKFDPRATNKQSTAKGLGQLIDATAAELGVTDPFDPAQNMDGTGRYLKKAFDKWGTWEQAIAQYFAGPGNMNDAGGDIDKLTTEDKIRSRTKAHLAAIFDRVK